MRHKPALLGIASLLLLSLPLTGRAQAWIAPDREHVRLALEQLVDDGVVSLPVLSWPISRRELRLAMAAAHDVRDPAPRTVAALALLEAELDPPHREWSLSAGEPAQLRGFDDVLRENAEAAIVWRWNGSGSTSGEFHGRIVASPEDGQSLRPDGTYVATRTGNWLWSAGWQDRWWGGGYDGSLELSSNARPVFALSLDRETSVPFESRWLAWMGHWTLGTFIGALEGSRPDSNHALLWGFRAAMRPLAGLELSLTRNAQFCGDKPPCSPRAFWNVVTGHDNQGENVRPEDEPGNQLATLEARWGGRIGRVPLAVYVQRTGETIDNKIPRPLRSMDLLGLSTWGDSVGGTRWRAHLELSTTLCGDVSGIDQADCAYGNLLFTAGYRYRGRVLGHTTDSDSRQVALGLSASQPGGRHWSARLRHAQINFVGGLPQTGGHSVAEEPATWWVGEAYLRQPLGRSALEASVAVERKTNDLDGRTVTDPRGFLRWSRSF